MKVRRTILSVSIALLLAAGGLIAAEGEKKEFKATCPVSNKPAKEASVVETKDGHKVYFCCDNCPKAFAADPKKFDLAVHRQYLETEQVMQVACPLTGKKINKEATAEAGTTKVAFCCKNCLAEFNKADDAKKLEMAFSKDAMKKGFTFQVLCPVSGKPINPEEKVEYKGENVYFCCPNCPAAFEKDPEKFMDKLPQFKKTEEAEKN